MADKRRRSRARAKAAYKVRQDQRSDPKPKSTIARKLAGLTPPKAALRRQADIAQPKGALYAYDEQRAMAFADAPDVARIEAQPFLKWAGGKTSLLSKLDEVFPAEVERYVEPFLGGGAVFFHLKRRFPRMRAFLRDSNEELINCYRIVRDRTEELMEVLDEHAANFRKGGSDCPRSANDQRMADCRGDIAELRPCHLFAVILEIER